MWRGLRLVIVHAEYEALRRCRLPAFKGSTLRGALGHALRAVGCVGRCAADAGCADPDRCPAGALFDGHRPGTGGDGRSPACDSTGDRPAPYVLTPPTVADEDFRPGDRLAFQLTLLADGCRWAPSLPPALERLGAIGLGVDREPWRLAGLSVEAPIGQRRSLDPAAGPVQSHLDWPTLTGADLVASLGPLGEVGADRNVLIRFVTPTQFQTHKRLLLELDGRILFSRLLRRLGAILQWHAGLDLSTVPFADLLREASRVRCLKPRLELRGLERYSNRQGRSHPLRGFVGSVRLQGIPDVLWPYLAVGQWLHIGKGSTFGLGKYELKPVTAADAAPARAQKTILPVGDFLVPVCAEIAPHLREYASNPQQFDKGSQAVMKRHLEECRDCEGMLASVRSGGHTSAKAGRAHPSPPHGD